MKSPNYNEPSMLKKVAIAVAIGLIVSLSVSGAIYVFGKQIGENASNHWCGLFVKDSSGLPVPNLAVRLPSYGTYAYSTDATGYTGKIWTTGLSNGCPGGLSGVEIPATVLYHNTEYATYLKADQNVTLTLT